MKLSRGEYWILELVTEYPHFVNWLFAENLDEVINKPSHGLERIEIINILKSFVDKKYIFLRNHKSGKNIENPTKEFFETSSIIPWEKHPILYGLTNDGGHLWEQFAMPDWNKYISCYYDSLPEEEKVGSIEGVELDFLHSYMISLDKHEIKVDRDSITTQVIKPWEATYWKTLPECYRMEFRYEHRKTKYNQPEPWWLRSLWYRWN